MIVFQMIFYIVVTNINYYNMYYDVIVVNIYCYGVDF